MEKSQILHDIFVPSSWFSGQIFYRFTGETWKGEKSNKFSTVFFAVWHKCQVVVDSLTTSPPHWSHCPCLTFYRFTEDAENVIERLEDEITPPREEHNKQVMTTKSQITLPQVLIRRLKRWSHVSACGFFTVDRSLVTAFLATTFTYWVILVQFTQTANSWKGSFIFKSSIQVVN